jgi:hypothetical protein
MTNMRARRSTLELEDSRSAGRVRFLLFITLLVLCFLGGGGSRDDILSHLYLYPAAVMLLASILAIPGQTDFASVRAPMILLGALALIMALQLVPLPPSVWAELPGHARFLEAAAVAGVEQPWRPISVAPDQTLGSLAWLVIPASVLGGYACLERPHRHALLQVLLALIFAGTLLGIAQIVGGPESRAYLYRITNAGSAVGWFSNRNHQAALLSATFPMLAVWASLPEANRQRFQSRAAVAAVFAIILIPMILVTGSRAGLFLAIIAVAASFFSFGQQLAQINPFVRRHSRVLLAALVAASAALVAAAILMSRAQAWDRLVGASQTDGVRIGNLPIYFQMISDFFPFGSGFGSFEALYKIYEPAHSLTRAYLNRAHNDLAELLITGSLPALIVLLAGLWWFARAGFVVYRRGASPAESGLARTAVVIIAILLLASLVDYPLRTGIGAAVLALAAAWLSDGSRAASGLGDRER